jgi:hypothetical protein
MTSGDGGSVMDTVPEAQVKRVSYAEVAGILATRDRGIAGLIEAPGPIRRAGHLVASGGDPSGARAA